MTGGGSTRHGLRYWLLSYRRMLHYDLVSQREWLPFLFVIQLLLSSGMAVLYGFYLPAISPRIAAFIVTGTPALALIPIGFVAVPGVIADQKTAGTYEYVRSFPVPRMAAVASATTVFTLLALPGLAVALALASWRYGVDVSISPLIVPAVALTAVMATCIGAALGHAIQNPMVTNLVTNLLIFFVLLFSPIVFPPEQFPHWLVQIHEWLPFYPMAIVLRDALSNGLVTGVGHAYAVLGGWTIASLALTARVVAHRR